jgi:hypothetical protein
MRPECRCTRLFFVPWELFGEVVSGCMYRTPHGLTVDGASSQRHCATGEVDLDGAHTGELAESCVDGCGAMLAGHTRNVVGSLLLAAHRGQL